MATGIHGQHAPHSGPTLRLLSTAGCTVGAELVVPDPTTCPFAADTKRSARHDNPGRDAAPYR